MAIIQIITIETKNRVSRAMIEEAYKNDFKIYISNKGEKYFDNFILLDKKFKTAKSALEQFIKYFDNDIILKVNNEISSLFNTDEIKNITKCNNVTES